MTKYGVEKVNVLIILLPIEAATVDLIMAVTCGVSYTP